MAIKKKATKKPGARSAPKKSARKIAAPKKRAIVTDQLPRIGEVTADGEFVGIARGADGQPDYKLFRGPYAPKRLNHAAALDFAALCRQGGHKDWELPDRTDGALLYANGRDQAKSGWHWLKPQHAHGGACAWCQRFGYGDQDSDHKSTELEVVLVRRVPIQ